MLKKDEVKVLKVLLDDISTDLTIMDVANALNQKYVQTYRTIYNLEKSHLIILKPIGKSKIAKLNFTKIYPSYILAELERTEDLCKRNTSLSVIRKKIQNLGKNFICILFGSQTKKPTLNSDIDLLFVIPNEYDYGEFEKSIHNQLIAANVDLVIVPESSLHEMWSHPKKLNIGNEILKKHIILYGTEHYLNLLRKHYVG